jgi:hypothetical protein
MVRALLYYMLRSTNRMHHTYCIDINCMLLVLDIVVLEKLYIRMYGALPPLSIILTANSTGIWYI